MLMRDTKPYLDPCLLQEDLAKQLHISCRTLSRILREQTNQHFNAFLNEYRLEEARDLLHDDRYLHLSIEALAQQAGFNSRAVFYRSFKQKMNVSPAAYRARRP